MMKQIKLPCGLNKDGKLIYIDETKNGLACECVCPGCKQPLVAKNNGKKNEHHFAHKSKDFDCEHGYQSALHYMAKDCFLELEYLTFLKNGVAVRYKIDSVVLEQKVDDIIPDILVTCDGKRFIVEIYVTHAVDDEKKQKIKDLQISAVEIDLSRFHYEMIDKAILKQALGNTANFSWVYDADIELIEQKKAIIQQFGLKIPIQQIGNAVGCPILANQKKWFIRFLTLDFCLHCPNCVYQNGDSFVTCGRILPLLAHSNSRRRDVFVNDNKVMFATEFREYDKNFAKNLERAMQNQYYIFLNISRGVYVSTAAYTTPQGHSSQNYRKNHYYNHRRKR